MPVSQRKSGMQSCDEKEGYDLLILAIHIPYWILCSWLQVIFDASADIVLEVLRNIPSEAPPCSLLLFRTASRRGRPFPDSADLMYNSPEYRKGVLRIDSSLADHPIPLVISYRQAGLMFRCAIRLFCIQGSCT